MIQVSEHEQGLPLSAPEFLGLPPICDTKVLVVDDDLEVLEAYGQFLRSSFQVEIVPDPSQAISVLAREGGFAVVISDMRMPGMDGIEFLSRVRASHPEAVRILVTAYPDMELAIEAVNRGRIDRFMTKPCDLAHLEGAIRSGIELHRLFHSKERLLSILQRKCSEMERLESLKNNLVEMIVNDLRPPVRSVCEDLAELSDVDQIGTVERRRIKRATGSAWLARELVESMLNVDLLERGQQPIDEGIYDLRGLVRAAIDIMMDADRIGVQFDRTPLPVRCDSDLIRRVVFHLIRNALQFSPEESKIRVEIVRDEEWARVRVIDEGIGIPPEERHRIFENFVQLAPSGGCGLGLAFCRLALELHKGVVEVTANPEGRGSVFWFVLPLDSSGEPSPGLLS